MGHWTMAQDKGISVEGLGSAVILFYVGEDNDQVCIHQKRLCAKSVVFEKAYNQAASYQGNALVNFLRQVVDVDIDYNHTNGGVRLPFPKFRVDTMSTLVEYIYTDTLPAEMAFVELYHLYQVAGRFEMPVLINLVTDRIRDLVVKSSLMFGVDAIATMYENRYLGKGKLWEFCLASIAGSLAWGQADENWSIDFRQFCSQNPRVPIELLEMQMAFGGEIHKTELQRRKPVKHSPFHGCQFHVHYNGELCNPQVVVVGQSKKKKKKKKNNTPKVQPHTLTKNQRKALRRGATLEEISSQGVQGGKVSKKKKTRRGKKTSIGVLCAKAERDEVSVKADPAIKQEN